jgi:hypothetical protein
LDRPLIGCTTAGFYGYPGYSTINLLPGTSKHKNLADIFVVLDLLYITFFQEFRVWSTMSLFNNLLSVWRERRVIALAAPSLT